MKTTSYLTLDVILLIHEDQVDLYGGSQGIRDLGLIQSAIARPQSTFGGEDLYPNIFDKAAALFHSLLFNHAFIDGNKRTSIVSSIRFLNINGFDLNIDDNEFVSIPLSIEKNHLSIEEISKILKKYSVNLKQ